MNKYAQFVISIGLAIALVCLGIGGCVRLAGGADSKEPLISIKAESSK